MADTTNVKLGVCSVSFGGTDLGHTKGGVEVTYSPEFYDMTVDKYGNTPYDAALIGEMLSAKVPLAEFTVANLGVAMPAATETASKVTVGKNAGFRLETVAAELVLHPIANEASDLSEDVVFYKAVVKSEVLLPYKTEEERIIEVTFNALLDESKSDGNYLGLFGDSTA